MPTSVSFRPLAAVLVLTVWLFDSFSTTSGGGEGATLREVLKHDTVKQVIMIEIDKGMVDMSRQYLPEWSDCSNIVGSTASCFDDPRVTVFYQDAVAWFIDNYTPGKETKAHPVLDVIIMDAL